MIRRFTWLSVLVLAMGMTSQAVAQGAELDKAYKREIAFLEAERGALRSRLAELQREDKKKLDAARAEIDALQGRATNLGLEADSLAEQLGQAEEKSLAESETRDVLDSTLQQAEVALSKGGITLPSTDGEPKAEQRLEQLDFAFQKSVELLSRYGSVYTEPGEFFAADGKKISGQVVHVGRVAAFGVGQGTAGALAPAGEGRLKLWPEGDSSASAAAIAAGRSVPRLDLFLFESLDKEIEKPKEKTFDDLMKAGGPIGWIILGLGCLALLTALLRAALLARAAANTEHLVADLAPLLKRHDVKAALERVRSVKSSAARVLEATLRSLRKPREQLEDIISEAILTEQPSIDRFGSLILIAAAVAPLLGLLGTVTGMISTFDVITEYGNSNPKLLAGGISEALVTTEFGLIVAIPALLIGNLLNGWAQKIKDDIDSAALRVTNIANGNDVKNLSDEEVDTPSAPPALLAPAE